MRRERRVGSGELKRERKGGRVILIGRHRGEGQE